MEAAGAQDAAFTGWCHRTYGSQGSRTDTDAAARALLLALELNSFPTLDPASGHLALAPELQRVLTTNAQLSSFRDALATLGIGPGGCARTRCAKCCAL